MAFQAKIAVSTAAANGRNGHSLISDEKFRQLYALALGLRHSGSPAGGEAALAGIAADLRSGDLLLAAEPGALAPVLCQHVPNLIRPASHADAGERLIEALSTALVARLRKSGNIAVILAQDLLRDSDSAQLLLGEAHRIADSARLPVLFVEHEDADTAPSRRSRANGKALGYQMPRIPVDAHDVIAMYRVAHESIARAREGSGPTRILCVEAPASQANGLKNSSADAIASLEHWLEARGLPAKAWRQEIIASLHSARTGAAAQQD